MLSLPDMAILGVLALLVFGEQKLPGIMRQAGRIMREVQNTSQSFIREMERAADVSEPPRPSPARYAAEPAEPPSDAPPPEPAEANELAEPADPLNESLSNDPLTETLADKLSERPRS